MSDPLYHDRLLSHYYAPLNYGLFSDFDLEINGFNPLCGDSIAFRLKMFDDRIGAISFESKGCVINRASASLLTEHVKGMSRTEVSAITQTFLISHLLGVTLMPSRIRCASLALETIQNAFREEGTV